MCIVCDLLANNDSACSNKNSILSSKEIATVNSNSSTNCMAIKLIVKKLITTKKVLVINIFKNYKKKVLQKEYIELVKE